MSHKYTLFIIILLQTVLCACNKDDVFTTDVRKPLIQLDDEYGIYTAKVGHSVTVAPKFEYVLPEDIQWICDGRVIATGPEFTATFNEVGEFYYTVSATNKAGRTEEDIRIDVLELTPPVISMQLPPDGLKIQVNTDYVFAPDYQHADLPEFAVTWYIDDELAGNLPVFTFRASETGNYKLSVIAENEDGRAEKEFIVEVVEHLDCIVNFPTPSLMQNSPQRYTFVGRPVFLAPIVEGFIDPQFSWSIDGAPTDCTAPEYLFVPESPGIFVVTVTVTAGASDTSKAISKNLSRAAMSAEATVLIECVAATEADRFRASSAISQASLSDVYEWIPAPGQFINLPIMQGAESSHATAVAWANEQLKLRNEISLGAFGGYIIVGFDHSIRHNSEGIDFAIAGNSFIESEGHRCSNEPGIVWVMQDVNGNGIPDDEWYELAGSETARRSYKVTYFKPEAPRMSVSWLDCDNLFGEVDYMSSFHRQDYYYPLWIPTDSYTLCGTLLEPKIYYDAAYSVWNLPPYGFGYADNIGTDAVEGLDGQYTGFNIANACLANGDPIALKYIDFIKVQSGSQAKAPVVGEVSTEVRDFVDCNITNKKIGK